VDSFASVDVRLGVKVAIISGDKKKLDGDFGDGETVLESVLVGQLSPKLGGGGG
jgi:hypothetical protein